jgi:hypothetical protein
MKSITPRILTLALAGLLSAASASALAQSTPGAATAPTAAAPAFKTHDSNGDGKISLEEYKARGGQEQAFRDGDTNQDKSLSSDEFLKKDKPATNRY